MTDEMQREAFEVTKGMVNAFLNAYYFGKTWSLNPERDRVKLGLQAAIHHMREQEDKA